ncbi:hypothetical protein A2U01_0081323, partial [Trifolium medium]|nr:hypothetical protein [Trifolium medium]
MVATCEDNIAKWKAEIKALETKIAEEESRKEHFTRIATNVSRSQIEATSNEGLKCFSSAEVINEEVLRLTDENKILDIK